MIKLEFSETERSIADKIRRFAEQQYSGIHREVKYRLWDFEENKMIYPSIGFDEKYVLQLNCEYMGEFNGKKYDTIKFPKMEYSGFKDGSGVELYEGDFLKPLSEGVYYYLIKFEKGSFVLYSNLGYWGTLQRFKEVAGDKIKRIGNVFENLEI